MNQSFDFPPIRLFNDYLQLTGIAHIEPETTGDPRLIGKRVGILNGSSWITLWSNYFGRLFLPGAHLVNIGNEAIQINFMEFHAKGMPVPPQSNIDAFCRYAIDLVELAQVDAVLITCSTMNRSFSQVQSSLAPYKTPVIQIDQPMMECAVKNGGKVMVIATHGPTVDNTRSLLQETADRFNQEISIAGITCEEAWQFLAKGNVQTHNQVIADAIHRYLKQDQAGSVVLAQLSMSVFLLSYPDPVKEFGLPVFTSGKCGFEAVKEILLHTDQA